MNRHFYVGPFTVWVGRLDHPGDQALGVTLFGPFAKDPGERALCLYLGKYTTQICGRTS